ncbi:hypothetical protein XO10_09905 [Marinitoga sp. 1135]|uniref:Putative HD superfamily hydrolase n=1 Tax=Marinitoga piezophila (strain DSM 14283 / JCM 11233 / KA3) TaxID=443254 RepID=H2J715_MARPK|nr:MULTISPECIES: YfbR-like 5'-deoxynucleotidase [Marinitoga]AEX86385.1 putative HD superfamily hydrolase [Marinitoga piezophila KA3]APT76777.1 hypothetical protein LN42_10625 [Marinitoga sp. 1137]NUU96547.1 hypothetical protein [Marinitoga sp. 1135]NUU98478.1 hypothetical protein [Marinitoga sp. 1138]
MGIGKSLFDLTNLFTIYRWNNRPALVRFTEADNVFHSLLLELIALEYLNQNHGYKLSISKNIKAKLYKELPKIILSDVSLDTKKRILKKDKSIWDKVLDKSYKELKEGIVVDIFKSEYDEKFEKYSSFIDLMVALKEIEVNYRVFPEYFSEPKTETENKIKELRNLEYIDELENILSYVLTTSTRMTTMYRWNKNHRNVRSSVSAHTFMVVSTAIVFYYLDNQKDENLLNEIIIASILHDFPEAFTGDVITPTKKKVEGLEEIITDVENEMIEEWLKKEKDTEELFKNLKDYMIMPFEKEYGRYVRAADLFNAFLESAIEIKTGNSQNLFREAFFSIKKELKRFNFDFMYDLIDEIEKITFF